MDVFVFVINEFIDFRSLLKLDTALTNQAKRKFFLDSIQSKGCCVDFVNVHHVVNSNNLKWMQLRQVSPRKWLMSFSPFDGMKTDSVDSLFSLCSNSSDTLKFKNITYLHCSVDNMDGLNKILKMCPNPSKIKKFTIALYCMLDHYTIFSVFETTFINCVELNYCSWHSRYTSLNLKLLPDKQTFEIKTFDKSTTDDQNVLHVVRILLKRSFKRCIWEDSVALIDYPAHNHAHKNEIGERMYALFSKSNFPEYELKHASTFRLSQTSFGVRGHLRAEITFM